YAGGLGILSGDHLKAASALGVPLVGVSLLYQEGYGRQVLDASGWQLDRFPSNRFDLMPLRVERTAEGRPLVVEVPLPGWSLSLLVWSAQVGRVALYRWTRISSPTTLPIAASPASFTAGTGR